MTEKSDDNTNNMNNTAGSSGITTQIPGNNQVEVARIQIKAPPFWKANPALWFCQLEAQFEMNRMTADKSKYFTVVAAIESSILNQVSDLVLNPPDRDMYTTLKTRLLGVFVDSEQSRLKKLLGEIELADQKPSFLLREMRNLAGNAISSELLKTLWLQRLPSNIQAILSISSEDIERLSVMADKIFETTINSEIHKISSRPNDSTSLDLKLTQISKELSELKSDLSRGRNFDNKAKAFKPRSRSQTPAGRSTKSKLCWYHSKFGEKAAKCVGECNFKPISGN